MIDRLTESQQNFLEKCNSSVGPVTEEQNKRARITRARINNLIEKELREEKRFEELEKFNRIK